MGKYTSQVRQRKPKGPEGPHPVWSSLGCLMLLIVPAVSIAAAVYTVQIGLKADWPIPTVLLQPIRLPDLIYKLPGLASLLLKVVSVDYLPAYAMGSLLYMVVLGGIVSFLYALLYRFTAPSKYGPLDEPPIKKKVKPFKR